MCTQVGPKLCNIELLSLDFECNAKPYLLSFPAMDVACLRPSAEARSNKALAPNSSFSDGQSIKLYDLLTRLYKVGGYSHTFGALDPVQAVQMAPHLASVYVSGWQCSSTASTTNEPGPGE